ncbi:hypothetical protein ACFE04_021229 [Oxalis oulophora]
MGGVVPQLQDHFLDASFMVFNFREGGLIPFAIHLFGLFFIPESPRWLAKTGRKMDFEVALQKLHGLDTDISEDAAEIQPAKTHHAGLFSNTRLYMTRLELDLWFVNNLEESMENVFIRATFLNKRGVSAARETVIYAIIQVIIMGLNTTVIDNALYEHVKLLLLLEEVVDWCSGGSASGGEVKRGYDDEVRVDDWLCCCWHPFCMDVDKTC